MPGSGTGFSGVLQLGSMVWPTRCLGRRCGRGTKISPAVAAASEEAGGGGWSWAGDWSAKPRERSLSAIRWIAEVGRVWASVAGSGLELRIRNLGLRVVGVGWVVGI